MRGRGRNTSYLAKDVGARESGSSRRGLPLHQQGERRTTRYGGDAALGLEADFANYVAGHCCCEFQDIPAGRILELNGSMGVGQDAGVLWTFEVLQELRRVHGNIVGRTCKVRNRSRARFLLRSSATPAAARPGTRERYQPAPASGRTCSESRRPRWRRSSGNRCSPRPASQSPRTPGTTTLDTPMQR